MLATFIGWAIFLLPSRRRKRAEDNIKKVCGEKSPFKKIVRRIFVNYAKYYTDFFYLSRLAKNIRLEEIKGFEFLKSALAKKKGVILATAHLGHWEYGGMSLVKANLKVNAIAEQLQPASLYRFYKKEREKLGIKIISARESVRVIQKRLKNNEIVAMLSDRVVGGRRTKIKWGKEEVNLPPGPVVMALRCGAPIVPGFTYRKKNNDYASFLLPPIEIERKENIQTTIAYNLSQLAKVLKREIENRVNQWYNLQSM